MTVSLPLTIIAVVIAFIIGMIVSRMWDFFVDVEKEDDRDTLITQSNRLATSLQEKLARVKDKVREIEQNYMDCRYANTELQQKNETLERENAYLKARYEQPKHPTD